MAKDRLLELQKLTNKKKSVTIEIDQSNNTQGLKQTFERADVLRQWVESIESNLNDIRKYLKNSNSLEFEYSDVQNKLESLFANNTSIAHKVSETLKTFDEELQNAENSAESRIKAIQYNTIKTRFTNAFMENGAELDKFKSIQKQKLEAQIRAKGINVTDEQLICLLESGKDIQLFTENIIAETAEAKRMLNDIEERHAQLLKIERMLTEVRDMFVQMSILVDHQQELLNRVEYQAQSATDYVHGVDLKAVRKSKNKACRIKVYFGIAAGVLLIIVIILLLK